MKIGLFRYYSHIWDDCMKRGGSGNGNAVSMHMPGMEQEMALREVSCKADLAASADVIRCAFAPVALQFGLTPQNCPSNAAFITTGNLVNMKDKGVRLFGLFTGGMQIGFVGIENAGDGTYYMEKLAVVPEYRHKGLGTLLMDFVFDFVKGECGQRISIGMIDRSTVLRKWYENYGFETTDVKRFGHLPFKVRFMVKKV